MKTQLAIVLCLFLAPFAARPAHAAQQLAATSPDRPSSSANGGNFGLGLMLGEPTGITSKYWLSNAAAFDIGLAFSFSNYFAVLGDYLWHLPRVFDNREFVPYFGVGAIVLVNESNDNRRSFFERNGSNHDLALGARVPLGIEWLPHKAPVGVYAEIVPGLGIVPGTFGFIQGDIGARFYF